MASSGDSTRQEEKGQSGHRAVLLVTSHHGQVLYRGIPLDYIDRTGHISVWNVAKMISSAVDVLCRCGYTEREAALTDTRRAFLVRQRLVISPRLHSETSKIIDTNILVTATAGKVGKSSRTSNAELRSSGSDVAFVKCAYTGVLFDTNINRPVPYPKWFAEKYCSPLSYIDNSHIQAKKDMVSFPSNAHRTQLKVRHSDTDFNMHVANAEYLRYCMEAATDASISGYFRHFSRDMCWYPVLELDIIYLAQSRPGEMLDVYTWQDEYDIQAIYFSIHRDRTAIAVSAFKFGFGENTSHL
ncbi:uncharacterized protein LOC110451909 isoform X2 [Mizuhopecten yessoensis]|uniref:Acyl-ACP thioesterase n=1 Tax=Mizuhopecten yessoensis TaxID=6573 RepID=A0A210QL29_MIZYE|nr:uncharacterized protein LOC110451909 isoform X2 [Mizuhopecten yessoensis]OWF49371.1 hypothetical protein KP79_PYT05022 [Mizuhopecten yessoensis]